MIWRANCVEFGNTIPYGSILSQQLEGCLDLFQRSLPLLAGVVVYLKKSDASGEFEDDAPDGPDVAGGAPAQLEDDLGRAVVPRRDDGRVVLVVEGGAAKVDQPDLGVAQEAEVLLPLGVVHEVVAAVVEEDVLRLEVGVRQPVVVHEADRVAQLVGNLSNLIKYFILEVFAPFYSLA